MFLVRSIVVAHPNRRDELVGVYKEFANEVLKDAGATGVRVLTASIGPSDSTVISESEHKTLAEFEQTLEKINKSPKMAKYGPKFGEMTVPGTHRFEIYRLH